MASANPFGLNFGAPTAPKLYVFDFDLTILNIHSFGSRIRARDVPSRDVLADIADLEFFTGFVDCALAAGATVAIASFGEYEVIQQYMDRVKPGVFTRRNISTPSCVGQKDGSSVPGGKNPQLQLLLETLMANGGPVTDDMRAHTVLFDDDESNIKRATSQGYIACFTPEAFTRRDWPSIKSYMPDF